MLTAFSHGKVRRVAEDIPAGASLRRALTASEDMLTAAVFERLAYLSDTTLWLTLQGVFRLPHHPAADEVRLLSIEFWPLLPKCSEKLGKAVEPDVILRFAFPEGRTIALVVECKLGAIQSAQQWAEEWIAFQMEDSEEPASETYLLALGGFPARPTVPEFTAEALKKHGVAITAFAADWSDILRVSDGALAQAPSETRVFADIADALSLFGYRRFEDLQTLTQVALTLPTSRSSPHQLQRLGD
jgi:hypothetical protein